MVNFHISENKIPFNIQAPIVAINKVAVNEKDLKNENLVAVNTCKFRGRHEMDLYSSSKPENSTIRKLGISAFEWHKSYRQCF